MKVTLGSSRAIRPRRGAMLCLLVALLAIFSGCNRHAPAPDHAVPSPAPAAPPVATRAPQAPPVQGRDLSVDESMGGHTLARHVGKTDAELAERLRREPQISAASTYTDRTAASRAVTAALDASSSQVTSWLKRKGGRPNLVLRYVSRDGVLGRSLARRARAAVPCVRAVVVLRWDERRNRFYVLTSYPEADR